MIILSFFKIFYYFTIGAERYGRIEIAIRRRTEGHKDNFQAENLDLDFLQNVQDRKSLNLNQNQTEYFNDLFYVYLLYHLKKNIKDLFKRGKKI